MILFEIKYFHSYDRKHCNALEKQFILKKNKAYT